MKILNVAIKGNRNEQSGNAFLSLLVWFITFFVLIFFALLKEKILPNYFFFDANTIADFIVHSHSLVAGDSFSSTAAFYALFNVSRNSVIFSLLAAMIIMASFKLYLRNCGRSLSVVEFALLFFYMLLSVIYMTLLSKDFIVLLFIFPFLFFARKKTVGLLLWSLLAVFYAYYFRSYWFMFLVLFWGLYISSKYLTKPLTIGIVALLGLFCIAVVLQIALGVDVDNFRTIVNDVRLDQANQNAKSMILPFISGGGLISGWVNVSITWITFMIPLPLILSFSPYYLVISLLLMMLYYKFWKALAYELSQVRSERNMTRIAIACLILAFTLIQSLFEPDYGSYVRHLAPFYPLFFYVIYSDKKNLYGESDESNSCS